MIMKKIFILTILTLLCSGVLFATDINGKWKGSLETENGAMELTFVYKVVGEKISGTISTEMGEIIIPEGKITGETFEYVLDVQGSSIKHSGKIINEKEIKIKSSGDYGDSEFTIKKIEEK